MCLTDGRRVLPKVMSLGDPKAAVRCGRPCFSRLHFTLTLELSVPLRLGLQGLRWAQTWSFQGSQVTLMCGQGQGPRVTLTVPPTRRDWLHSSPPVSGQLNDLADPQCRRWLGEDGGDLGICLWFKECTAKMRLLTTQEYINTVSIC